MSGHDETIHPDYIPEDFRELLRMACDSVWEQGELYSEDLLLAAFKPAIDEHDRQIAEQAWENGIELSGWRDKAACRDMDPDLFFPQPRPARNDWRSRPAPNVRRYANAHGTRRNTTESAATHCKAYGVA